MQCTSQLQSQVCIQVKFQLPSTHLSCTVKISQNDHEKRLHGHDSTSASQGGSSPSLLLLHGAKRSCMARQ